jgi:hypothetical protein
MSARAAAAIVFAAGVMATPAHAQSDRWEHHVRRQLERAATSLSANGAAGRVALRVGMLNTDESESFLLPLRAGTSYVVVGACDEDCSRLGLVISDLASHELAADRASGNAAIVRITVRETASYRVRTTMESCGMNPCRYGVLVVTPPSP